jgi:hypothetical protein
MIQIPLYIAWKIKYIKIPKNSNGPDATIYSLENKIYKISQKFK